MTRKNKNFQAMKKHLLFLLCIFTLLLSCSKDDSIYEVSAQKRFYSSHINQTYALQIANKVIEHSPTSRSIASETPTIDCITQTTKNPTTRNNASVADTVAYIINYPNEGGFVIVS